MSPTNCPNCSKVGLNPDSNFVNSRSRTLFAVDSNSCWDSVLVPSKISVNVALKIILITVNSFVWTMVDPGVRPSLTNKSNNNLQHLCSKNIGLLLLEPSFLWNVRNITTSARSRSRRLIFKLQKTSNIICYNKMKYFIANAGIEWIFRSELKLLTYLFPLQILASYNYRWT